MPSPRNQGVPDFGKCGKELRERREWESAERILDYRFIQLQTGEHQEKPYWLIMLIYAKLCKINRFKQI